MKLAGRLQYSRPHCHSSIYILIALAFWMIAVSAQSVPVPIDPGQYKGQYKVTGPSMSPIFRTGTCILDVPPGIYAIDNNSSVGGSSFNFTVDTNGPISSQNLNAAVVIENRLTFNNVTIHVNPGLFTGAWRIGGMVSYVVGAQSLVLIPGLTYSIDNGSATLNSAWTFDVGATGQITSHNSAAGYGSDNNTLVFNNATIMVDPLAFQGTWRISRMGYYNGRHDIVVIPGLRYGIDNGSGIAVSYWYFDVGASGHVTSLNTEAAQGDGNTLVFNNMGVTVVPEERFTGSWKIGGMVQQSGKQRIFVVPGLDYQILLVDQSASAQFHVSQSCMVSPREFYLGGYKFQLICNNPPLVSAGDSYTAEKVGQTASVRLSRASASDPEGDALLYQWSTTAPSPVFSDATALNPTLTFNASAGTGATYIATLMVSDGQSNPTAAAMITVVDTQPPVITLNGQSEMTLEAGVDTYTEPGAAVYDACDGVVVVSSSGTVAPNQPGNYVITYTASDKSGHTATATRTVIVRDSTPPALSVSVTPAILWPPDHRMIKITPTLSASDKCDPTPRIALVSITMNEGDEENTYYQPTDNNPGDGNTVGDIQVDAQGQIYLRAERSGTGSGRTYTLLFKATDFSNNYSETMAKVSVPHDQK